jgi:hypothetical protein
MKKMENRKSLADRTSIEERQQRLENEVEQFHQKMDVLLNGIDCDDVRVFDDCGESEWDYSGSDEDNAGPDLKGKEPQDVMPERMSLFLPSSLDPADVKKLGLEGLAKQELELRKGQANDTLDKLRLALGNQALLYRTRVSVTDPHRHGN